MSTFVAMFYSQRSRKLLLKASKTWNTNNELFSLLKQILDDKYLKTASRESEDYENFSDDTFSKILSLLYNENSKAFPYNPETVDGGFAPINYIGKLYKLLNVDYKIYEYSRGIFDSNLYYSYMNEDFDNIRYRIVNRSIQKYYTRGKEVKYFDIEKKYKKEEVNPPQVLIVDISNNFTWTNKFYFTKFPHTIINEGDTKENLTSMRDKIKYQGSEYNLDSVILANFNIRKNHGHTIAGITCKREKFLYNGWTRESMDPVMANKEITRNIPCELMKYNWNIRRGDNSFCLNTKKCIPDILKEKDFDNNELCFNFGFGDRILIYVRKKYATVDTSADTSIEKEDDIQKYFEARAISEERKRAISEERKRAISEERKRAISEERKRAIIKKRDDEINKIEKMLSKYKRKG
jgi:hypothetical protein